MLKKDAKRSQKCMVCGKEVPQSEWIEVNAAVTGPFLSLGGHSACVHNVNDLVVIPNRLRLLQEAVLANRSQTEKVKNQAFKDLTIKPFTKEVSK